MKLPGIELPCLNLGCGEDYLHGAVNVDQYASRVDVRHDLNVTPYPFESGLFRTVRCMNILEHLNEILPVLEEIHRIAADNALVQIRVPHFRSASLYEDITHRHGFAWRTLDAVIEGGTIYGNYSTARFRSEGRRYTSYLFPPLYSLLSRFPVLTDNLLSKFIPMASIEFTLRAVKR